VTWSGVLADRSGSPYGELRDVEDRKWRKVVSRPRTASFRAQVDNPLADRMLDLDLTLLKLYENTSGVDQLRFLGPLITFEKVRDSASGTIQINCHDPFWFLGRRLLGKDFVGFAAGSAIAPIDRGTIGLQVLAAANADGDTGIRAGAIAASTAGHVGPWRFKQADQAFVELAAAGLGGFDWNLEPVEPVADDLGVQLARLDIAPVIGTVRPDVVFEFGAGKNNVSGFRDLGDAGALCNRAWSLPPGFPDDPTLPILSAVDRESLAAHGLHDAIVSSDVLVEVLRQALTDQAVQLRRTPKRVITFTPVVQDDTSDPTRRRTPRLFIDYDVGDIVQFKATEQLRTYSVSGEFTGYTPRLTVNAFFRVFGVEASIDRAGEMTPGLVLIQEG
jgi:hypothetical protein